MTITADNLAAMYLKMREAIQNKEEEIKEIKGEQEIVTAQLLALYLVESCLGFGQVTGRRCTSLLKSTMPRTY